jgi:hypothetical protein
MPEFKHLESEPTDPCTGRYTMTTRQLESALFAVFIDPLQAFSPALMDRYFARIAAPDEESANG